jgi:hypothetical protein
MKRTLLITGMILLTVFNSCKKDDDTNQPEIILHELGHDNEKVGYIGHELHVDADITARDKIAELRITIQSKAAGSSAHENENWSYDSIYTEFIGLRNTLLHKDIEIPEEVHEGDYTFHMSVSDQKGRYVFIQEDIELHHGEGNDH